MDVPLDIDRRPEVGPENPRVWTLLIRGAQPFRAQLEGHPGIFHVADTTTIAKVFCLKSELDQFVGTLQMECQAVIEVMPLETTPDMTLLRFLTTGQSGV